MKRWALLVAALYVFILLALTLPVMMVSLPKVDFPDAAGIYTAWPYWVWLGVMLLSQMALLAVPVRVASRRPVTRRGLWLPVVTAGLMMGGLVLGALFSVMEWLGSDQLHPWQFLGALCCGVMVWAGWSVLFSRLSRGREPSDVVSRQCRLLFRGSILELLVAVPTHIVCRSREYCCAGFMTFFGLTLGLSVMLFSFGPAVFFLYADRWRRRHPGIEPKGH